jgi:hypothetical protein
MEVRGQSATKQKNGDIFAMLAGRVWDHSVDKTMRTSKHKQKHF